MKWLQILSLLFLCSLAHSDTTVVVVPVDSTYFYPANPTLLKPFDKDFFNSKPQAESAKSITGKSRYYGDEISYNRNQREAWSEKCESQKRTLGMAAFRKCFASERQKSTDEIQKRRDELTLRNNSPFRSSP